MKDTNEAQELEAEKPTDTSTLENFSTRELLINNRVVLAKLRKDMRAISERSKENSREINAIALSLGDPEGGVLDKYKKLSDKVDLLQSAILGVGSTVLKLKEDLARDKKVSLKINQVVRDKLMNRTSLFSKIVGFIGCQLLRIKNLLKIS